MGLGTAPASRIVAVDFGFLDAWNDATISPETILADINRTMGRLQAHGDTHQFDAPKMAVPRRRLDLWDRLELRDRFPWWRPDLTETAPTVAAWLLQGRRFG